MKAVLLSLFTSLNVYVYAQTVDSTSVARRVLSFPSQAPSNTTLKSAQASNWWGVKSKDNVVFKVHDLQMSKIENEITDLESRECGAVKKRDTLVLIRLWARDFTLDKKQNEVVYSKHALPNYMSLTRMIENLTVVDSSTVFTSGYEMFQEIKDDWKVEPPAKRNYSHTWTRRNGLWKLTTKRTY